MRKGLRATAAARPVGTVETYSYTGKSGTLSEQFSKMGMEQHINLMLANGWEVVNQTGLPGHVRLGRTLAGAALTGGISLLAGGSRTADRVTITYRRVQVPTPTLQALAQSATGGQNRLEGSASTDVGEECSTCKYPNPPDARVCVNCGKILPPRNIIAPQEPKAASDVLCPQCETGLPSDAVFCRNCGTSIGSRTLAVSTKACTNCGSQSGSDATFCSKCGARLFPAALA